VGPATIVGAGADIGFQTRSGAGATGASPFVGTAYVARNLIQDNGWEGRQYADAGIAAVSSKNVLIEDNIFGGNAFGNGIKIIQDDRLTGERTGDRVEHRDRLQPDGRGGGPGLSSGGSRLLLTLDTPGRVGTSHIGVTRAALNGTMIPPAAYPRRRRRAPPRWIAAS
jgi:hypothetical protein